MVNDGAAQLRAGTGRPGFYHKGSRVAPSVGRHCARRCTRAGPLPRQLERRPSGRPPRPRLVGWGLHCGESRAVHVPNEDVPALHDDRRMPVTSKRSSRSRSNRITRQRFGPSIDGETTRICASSEASHLRPCRSRYSIGGCASVPDDDPDILRWYRKRGPGARPRRLTEPRRHQPVLTTPCGPRIAPPHPLGAYWSRVCTWTSPCRTSWVATTRPMHPGVPNVGCG
jgi:hypothetical protein